MTDATRVFLDSLDQIMLEGGETALEVWIALTALRGPDDGSDDLKANSTAVIRAAMFPRAIAEMKTWADKGVGGYFGRGYLNGFMVNPVGTVKLPISTNDHFHGHSYRAARLLGLEVIRFSNLPPLTPQPDGHSDSA